MSDLIKYCKATALDALNRISNYCEEIDLHLPEEERTGYSMLEDLLFLRRYILDCSVSQWISVKDRLPKKPNDHTEIRRCYFLVSLESGCVETLGFDFDRNEWHITGSPVLAWRPLPGPYKEPKE